MKPFAMQFAVVTNVERCARCKGDHYNVQFRTFALGRAGFTHWATCPDTGEPILMTVRAVPEPEAK